MESQPNPDDDQFRALVAEMINPDDPRLRAAVVEVLQGSLTDIFRRVGTDLENAGFPEAAEFVRSNFGGYP